MVDQDAHVCSFKLIIFPNCTFNDRNDKNKLKSLDNYF